MSAALAGAPGDGKDRLRLLAAASVPFMIGVLSKYYQGPGSEHVRGQALDFFGTVFMILAARAVVLRPPAWRVAGAIVGALTVMEISQRFHGEWLERARSTWIGLHVLGSCFEWLDLLCYYAGGAVALWLAARLVRQPAS